MKSFVPFNTEWWKHPAFWKLDAKHPRYPTMWAWIVKEAATAQNNGRLEISGGLSLGPEEFSVGYHRMNEGEWSEFINFCLSLGILDQDDGTLVITNWFEYFALENTRNKTADAYRKRAERAEKALEALKQGEAKQNHPSGHNKRSPDTKKECPDNVPECPDTSQMSQIRSDHIRSDQIRSKDMRSDNSACAENSVDDIAPPSTPERPATWSAALFSKTCFSSTDLIDEFKRDWRNLAACCRASPKRLNAQMGTDLLFRLGKGAFKSAEHDPLAQLIALRMGVNIAFDLFAAGLCSAGNVWAAALQHGERSQYAATRICELIRSGVWVGPDEAERHIPTTLEREFAST